MRSLHTTTKSNPCSPEQRKPVRSNKDPVQQHKKAARFVYLRKVSACSLFLPALGLCCDTWALGCGTQASLLVAGHGSRVCGLSSSQALECGLIVAHGLRCPMACGIFPEQGSNLCPLHWLTTGPPRKSEIQLIFEC